MQKVNSFTFDISLYNKLSLGLNLMGSCLLFHKLVFPQNPEEMCSGKPLQHRLLRTESSLTLLRVFLGFLGFFLFVCLFVFKSIFVSKDYRWHANIYCSGRFQPLWEQRPQRGKRASNSPQSSLLVRSPAGSHPAFTSDYVKLEL